MAMEGRIGKIVEFDVAGNQFWVERTNRPTFYN